MDIEMREGANGELMIAMWAGTAPPPREHMNWHSIKDFMALFDEVQETHAAVGKGFSQAHVDRIWERLNGKGIGRAHVQPPAEQNPKAKRVDTDAVYRKWNGVSR